MQFLLYGARIAFIGTKDIRKNALIPIAFAFVTVGVNLIGSALTGKGKTMRKAFRKARWKKKAVRVRKRGGEIFFGFRNLGNIKAPPPGFDPDEWLAQQIFGK